MVCNCTTCWCEGPDLLEEPRVVAECPCCDEEFYDMESYEAHWCKCEICNSQGEEDE